jgi:transcriptional regulator of aroF, aroG, tyrA and aromatic amino acid transport
VTVSDKAFLDAKNLDLAGSRAGNDRGAPRGDVSSWDEAIAKFEKDLLKRLYPLYPSSRKLAAHLKTSHTLIDQKRAR